MRVSRLTRINLYSVTISSVDRMIWLALEVSLTELRTLAGLFEFKLVLLGPGIHLKIALLVCHGNHISSVLTWLSLMIFIENNTNFN